MFNLFSSISCLYGIRTHLTWHYRVREIFCSTNNFELKKKSTRTRENLFCNFPFITLNLNQHPVADTNSLQVKRITFLFLNILIELHGLQSFSTKLRRKCLFVLATNIYSIQPSSEGKIWHSCHQRFVSHPVDIAILARFP